MDIRRLVILSLLGGIAGINCSGDSVSRSNAAINAAKAEVKKFVLDHLTAFESGDLDGWGAGMTDDVFMIAAESASAEAYVFEWIVAPGGCVPFEHIHLSRSFRDFHSGTCFDGVAGVTREKDRPT